MSSDANALLDEIGAPKKPAAKSAMDLLNEVAPAAPGSAHDLLDAVEAPAMIERPTPPNNIDPDVLTQQIHARAAQEEKDAHPTREALLNRNYSPIPAMADIGHAIVGGLDSGGRALRRVASDLNPFGAIKTEERSLGKTVGDVGTVLAGLPPVAAAGPVIQQTVGDPLHEAPADTTLGRMGQGLRGALRAPVDVPVEGSRQLTQLPGVKQGLEYVGGKDMPEGVASVLPFLAPYALGKLRGSPEPTARPGPPVDPMSFRESKPRVAPVRAGIRPVEAPAVSAHALLDEVGAPKAAEPVNSPSTEPSPVRQPAVNVDRPPVTAQEPQGSATAPVAPPEAPAPAAAPSAPQAQSPGAPSRFQGRPMSGEAGAIAIPGLPPPPDALPPGTPAERASIASVKERIRFGEEPKMPFVDRAADAAKKAEAQIVRKEAPLRRAEQFVTGDESDTGVTAQAKFAQGSSQGAAENLYKHGLLETGDVPAVEPALRAVVKAGRPLSDVSAYLKAKREVEAYDPHKIATGSDPAAIRASNLETIALYERDHPAVVKAADAVFKTNAALLDNLAEADRWTPERLQAVKDKNPVYVEFRRDFGDAGEGTGETPSGKAAPLNGPSIATRTGTAKGTPIRDPLVRLQDSFRRMIAAADQARVKHSFLDMIRSNPTRAAALVEELTPAQLKAQIPDFDAIASSMNPTTAVDDFGKTFDAYDRAYKAGIIPKGDGHFLKVKDPSIAEALKGGDYEAANALTKLAGNITAIQRTGITQVSPTFPLRNLVRDVGTYIAQAKEANDLKMFANLGRGLYHAIRGELTKVGVSDTPYTEVGKRARLEGFFAADTTKSAPQGLARMEEGPLRYYLTRPLKAPGAAVGMTFDVWKSLNSGIEHAPRYAALISELDRMGWKPGDALTRDMLVKAGNSAQEITVNFRLGGDTGKALNRYVYNFFNPAVQGAEQLRQTFANQPKLAVRRALTYGVAPAVASYLYWQADPKRQEAWGRMTPWRRAQRNFPSTDENGNVHVISLPVAQEAGAIYSATTAAMDGIRSGDPKRFTDVMKEIVSRANPVDSPLHPSVVAPIQEVNEGKFSFSGRAINPKNLEGVENVLPQEVKQPYSSKLAYAVASWLHDSGAGGWMGMGKLTTADIDALIQGYGGTAARDVTRTRPTGETEGADMPIVGTFFPRMKESRFVDDYYQQRQTFGGQENLVGFLRKSHKPEDAAKAASLRLPQGIAGDIARIDHRLKELADRYQAAPEAERAGIAAAADSAARHGLSLMKSAGVGSRKMPFAAKETR